jgi:hypothetical protein
MYRLSGLVGDLKTASPVVDTGPAEPPIAAGTKPYWRGRLSAIEYRFTP